MTESKTITNDRLLPGDLENGLVDSFKVFSLIGNGTLLKFQPKRLESTNVFIRDGAGQLYMTDQKELGLAEKGKNIRLIAISKTEETAFVV